MKPQIRKLKVGEKVWALVEEVLENNEMVVNFSGDLLRVSNESSRRFRGGQRVLLLIESTYPLRFKLVPPSLNSSLGRPSLDVSI